MSRRAVSLSTPISRKKSVMRSDVFRASSIVDSISAIIASICAMRVSSSVTSGILQASVLPEWRTIPVPLHGAFDWFMQPSRARHRRVQGRHRAACRGHGRHQPSTRPERLDSRRRTVSCEKSSCSVRTTISPSNNSNVQCARPVGGPEPAIATDNASSRPVGLRRAPTRGTSLDAASRPRSTNRRQVR